MSTSFIKHPYSEMGLLEFWTLPSSCACTLAKSLFPPQVLLCCHIVVGLLLLKEMSEEYWKCIPGVYSTLMKLIPAAVDSKGNDLEGNMKDIFLSLEKQDNIWKCLKSVLP